MSIISILVIYCKVICGFCMLCCILGGILWLGFFLCKEIGNDLVVENFSVKLIMVMVKGL